MLLRTKSGPLMGLTIGILLTACAGVTAIGAGCSAYAQARLALPSDADLLATPAPVLAWINMLDARMTAVCR